MCSERVDCNRCNSSRCTRRQRVQAAKACCLSEQLPFGKKESPFIGDILLAYSLEVLCFCEARTVPNGKHPGNVQKPKLYQKGSKKEPFFHAMISYRVATEALLARQLIERLLLKSFKRIPEVGLSEWPKGFSDESYRPEFANIFLDQKCLKPGENYKKSEEGGGFVGTLLKSVVFVPLLSWKKDLQENPNGVRFSGSIGGMVAKFSNAKPYDFLDPNPANRPFIDSVDNVLLAHRCSGVTCVCSTGEQRRALHSSLHAQPSNFG